MDLTVTEIEIEMWNLSAKFARALYLILHDMTV